MNLGYEVGEIVEKEINMRITENNSFSNVQKHSILIRQL